uniref:Cytochrome b n=1 Tax=Lygus hesperus TaxID=30085 RepID=A0A0A9W0Y0_LYGHE
MDGRNPTLMVVLQHALSNDVHTSKLVYLILSSVVMVLALLLLQHSHRYTVTFQPTSQEIFYTQDVDNITTKWIQSGSTSTVDKHIQYSQLNRIYVINTTGSAGAPPSLYQRTYNHITNYVLPYLYAIILVNYIYTLCVVVLYSLTKDDCSY